MTIQGKPLVFQVDSSAPFSFIPMNVFSGIKEYFPSLEPTDIKLNSYTESLIEVMDMAQVQGSYNKKVLFLTFVDCIVEKAMFI